MTTQGKRYITFKGANGGITIAYDPHDGGFGSNLSKALDELDRERAKPVMIEDLELSEIPETALLGADLTEIIQVQDLTIDDLLKIEGMNSHAVAEVMVALRKHGFK
jgi:hypothetical protein